MKYRIICLFFVCFFIQTSRAQENDLGNWMIYFGNQKINEKWNWNNEIQYRNYNFIGDLQQLLLRTGLGYNLTENNNNISLGYAFINSQPYVIDPDISDLDIYDPMISNRQKKINFNEHRIYQQFITRQSFGRVFIQHRYRFEQRIFEDGEFRMRLRYFLAVNIPLNKAVIHKGVYYLSAYNEVFLNTASPLYDRNRLYGAIGYGITNDVRFEFGIMSQIFERGSRPQLQFVVFNNIPFKKPKKIME